MKKYLFPVYLFLCVGTFLTSCKEENLLTYNRQKDAVYFLYVENITATDQVESFTKGKDRYFSFYSFPGMSKTPPFNSYDTVYTNGDYIMTQYGYKNLRATVQLAGRVADYDRPIRFSLSGKDKSLVLAPDSTVILPAGKNRVDIPLKFVAPPETDTTSKQIVIRLEDNAWFEAHKMVNGARESMDSVRYTFGNLVSEEINYLRGWGHQKMLGNYSAAKLKAIVAANWHNTGPMVQAINNEFNTTFKWFDYRLIYRYIYTVYPPTYAMTDAMKTSVIPNTKRYLEAQKNAGKPILDANGEEVTLP